MLTPNLTVTITTAKLIYATGIIEGLKVGNPKATQAIIDKELETKGFSVIEIHLIKSVATTDVVESVFNPVPHHRKGKGKATKKTTTPEVQSTVDTATDRAHSWDSDADETLEDNDLGV